MKKRISAILLALCMVLTLLPGAALAAEVASGTCGANITWSLDDAGTLTISGTGAITNYDSSYVNPMVAYNSSVKEVIIGSGVTHIGNYAFVTFTEMTDITIPVGVTSVGLSSFLSCGKLTNIYYSGSKAQWQAITVGLYNAPLTSATIHCSDGDIVPDTSDIIASGECGAQGDNVTWTLDKAGVLAISGTGAMADFSDTTPWETYRTTIKQVRIGNGVTTVGRRSFPNSNSLTSVTIPNSVTSIGNSAFFGCSSLTGVTIPNSVTAIGTSAFGYSGLTAVTIPSSVTSMGTDVFSGCKGLTSITIPSSLTSIPNAAFLDCGNLAAVTIPTSVASVGEKAFNGCEKLADVYYSGTKAQWQAITVNSGNEPLLAATLHCSDAAADATALPKGARNVGYATWLEERTPVEGETVIYTLDSNSKLPAGMALSEDGKLSGMPKETGEFLFSVIITTQFDKGEDDVKTAAYTLTILEEAEETPLHSGLQGSSYSAKVENDGFTLEDGQHVGYELLDEHEGLPQGLTLNEETGVITGTPEEAGLFRFTVVRRLWTTNPETAEATRMPFLLSIRSGSGEGEGDPVWPTDIPDGTQYVPYSSWARSLDVHEITLPDQPGTYTPETLPSLKWEGLRDVFIPHDNLYLDTLYIDNVFVPINRIRTAWLLVYERGFRNYGGLGKHTMTLNFLDSDGTPLVYNLQYEIEELTVSAPMGFTYEVNAPLPQGLTLNRETGEITGVPKVTGTWNFDVTITNLNGESETRSCTLVIHDNSTVDIGDNDYEIIDPVGKRDPQNSNHFLKDSYTDESLVIDGPFNEFMELYIDGVKLIRDTDYTAREGSTVITVHSQTFRKFGEGTHTISAEFRAGGKTNGTLKKVSQNYTLKLSKSSNNSGKSGGGSGVRVAKPQETETKPQSLLPFTDVSPSDWFYNDLVWAYQNGIMQGVSNTTFAPKTNISEATIVTVLARMAKVDLTQFEGATEEGIESGRQFTTAAIWAKRSGLLPEGGAFTGSETTTRDQMAVMLVRYLRSMAKDTTPPAEAVAFADAAEMSQEGNAAFQVLYRDGIFKGVGGLRMNASGSTTRAHFVALVHRIHEAALS